MKLSYSHVLLLFVILDSIALTCMDGTKPLVIVSPKPLRPRAYITTENIKTAITSNKITQLEFMLKRGIDPNQCLDLALTYQNADAIQLSLEYGANSNLKNKDG